METKHTTGPWITFRCEDGMEVLTKDAESICVVKHYGDPYDSKREEANARLIAAAPELLALMQDVLPILESMDHQREEGDEPMPLIDQVRATIAKATGKTP